MNNFVNKLIEKHKTNNPIIIAENLRIAVLYEDLGNINGFYNTWIKQKFIHINVNLPLHLKTFTAAHELGHAILHPKSNTPFLREFTRLSINKMEIEANKFAVNLLISDNDLKEYIEKEYTIDQLTKAYGLHRDIIMLRFKK